MSRGNEDLIQDCYNSSVLGLTLDSELTFSLHCDGLVKPCSRCVAFIRSLLSRRAITRAAAATIFRAPVLSKIHYVSAFWKPFLKGDRHRLERIQQRFTKYFIFWNDHGKDYNERLHSLGWSTIMDDADVNLVA